MIENPIEYKNKLLSDFATNKITLSELIKECAYWFMECFEEVNVKPIPTAPREYFDYNSLPFEKKIKMSNDFWQMPIIKNYLETKQMIENENKAFVYHLNNYLSYIPVEDTVARQKYSEKLAEFSMKDFY